MRLTVITINYNNKLGLERTLKSVINQSYKDFEYIIIDGASTDGGKELIEEYSGKISYWVSEPDKGIYNAMNKGIKAATGEYVLFINSGDELYEPNTLSYIINDLYNADILSGQLKIVNNEGSTWVWSAEESLTFDTFYSGTLCHPCTFIRRSLFDKYGYYDENFKIVSDWKWFMIVICRYNVSFKKLNNIISIFYEDGISSSVENQGLLNSERISILNREFPRFVQDYIKFNQNKEVLDDYNRSRLFKIIKHIKNIYSKLTK